MPRQKNGNYPQVTNQDVARFWLRNLLARRAGKKYVIVYLPGNFHFIEIYL